MAAPLFSEAELTFNRALTEALEEFVDVYLPQRDGGRLVDLVAKGVDVDAASRSIFQRDVEAIRLADALLIVMDGRSIDEGAAFELGFAHALGKHCAGLQTDPRRLLPVGNNPMIQVPLGLVVQTTEQAAYWARGLCEAAGGVAPPRSQVAPK